MAYFNRMTAPGFPLVNIAIVAAAPKTLRKTELNERFSDGI